MSLTFDQALANLVAARDAVPGAVEHALDEVGKLALAQVVDAWPVDSGRSAEGWEWTGSALVNDVPYVAYVHDGLADRLVPRVFKGLEDTFRELVEARVDAAGGFDG